MKKRILPYVFLLVFLLVIYLSFRLVTQYSGSSGEQYNSYLSHVIGENKLLIQTSLGRYTVEFYNASIAEVNFTASDEQPVDTSHAVVLLPDGHSISFTENDEQLRFVRDSLRVEVKKSPFLLSFFKNDKLILSESKGYFQSREKKGFRFALTPDEKIYGAGFRTTPTNRRGYKYELYNQAVYAYNLNAPDLNFSVPFVISSNGYGLLFDNAQRGWLDLDVYRKNMMEFSSIGGKMSYFIIAEDNYDSLLFQYGKLTGFQPMPPRWALGNIQSKFGYRTQAETEAIVDTLIKAGYPLDAVVIDLFWFGLGKHNHFYMGDMEWYSKNWPDPQKMIHDFEKRGVKTILITEPFILEESKNFEPASKAGLMALNPEGNTYVIEDFWFGPGGLIDIFKPAARQWFWDKYKAQNEIGVAGWWGDLGEPEKHPAAMIHAAGAADEVHNIYSHYWHKMLWDHYGREYPEVRPFNLNRAGFAGSQRYSVYPWSGDVSRDWNGLKAQPTAVLGMTLSGFSYMHSDLGGFARGVPDEELYVRWLQYGVFNPVYRPHGDTNAPVEPVFYSNKARKILKEYINLRYRMLPYNYSLAWLNSIKGTPLTRPLFFEEPDNTEISETDDTYLWGSSLLVAPVFDKGLKNRRLYMPAGNWFDFVSDEKFSGGQWIEVPVTLDDIPVFVKGGSIIPMIDPIPNTEKYSSENLQVHYYFDKEVINSSFTMYDDDGITKNAYEKGRYELLKMKATLVDDFVLFSLARHTFSNYTGMPETRTIELVIHAIEEIPEIVRLEKTFVHLTDHKEAERLPELPFAYYDADNHRLYIRFIMKDNKMNLQIIQ